jgi:ornithine carbamoyltransferase
MNPVTLPPSASAAEALLPARCQALLRRALALESQEQVSSDPPTPLLGRNIALLCRQPEDPALPELEAAAAALGARVARLDANGWLDESDAAQSEALLRMLERLYDAVDCEGLPPEHAQALQRRARLPVFVGLARADHAVRALAPQLRALRAGHNNAKDEALDQRHLVQALLLDTLGH